MTPTPRPAAMSWMIELRSKCRLACAALSDDVDMLPSISNVKAERYFSAPNLPHSKL